ncbi:MAG TPA: carboxypeptidase-like regulatory domain-containing protein [Chitinophagaceae bacterium]
MADNNNIQTFTAADIEKYHQGLLSSKEMHAMEKAALDDPFLADALEGYAVEGVNIKTDIVELKKRLAEKTGETKVIPMHGGGRSSFPWLRAAAVIIFLAGAGLLSYQFLFNKSATNIAQAPQKENNAVVKATEQAATAPQSHDTGSAPSVSSPVITSVTGSTANNGTAGFDVSTSASDISKTNKEEKAKEGKDDLVIITPGLTSTPASPTINEGYYKATENKAAENNTASDDKIVAKDSDKEKNPAFKTRTEPEKQAVMAQGIQGYVDNNNVAGVTAKQDNKSLYRNNAPNIFRGKVTDPHNNPLPFTNVSNTTDNVGTYTDAKGNFTLISGDTVMDVQLKAIGFENNKIRLRSDLNTNQIMLQEDKSMPAKIVDTVKRNYAARSRDGNLTLEEPEPIDGWAYYDTYLINNLNTENFDIKKNQGSDMVELSFEVNKNGDPVNIRVEKSLCDKCDKEAIRLVKEGPKWKRKAKKGKRTIVKVPFIKTD